MRRGNIREVPEHIISMLNDINPVILHAMEIADAASEKSNIKNFKTGASVFSLHGTRRQHISNGYSEYQLLPEDSRHTTHAEEVAIQDHFMRYYNYATSLKADSAFVFTRNRAGNIASSSRPCAYCMKQLSDYGIDQVFYLTVENFITVSLEVINPTSVIEGIMQHGGIIERRRYANKMRC